MQCLRALIIILVSSILSSEAFSQASLNLTTQISSVSGATVATLPQSQRTSGTQQNITITSERLKKGIQISNSIIQSKSDYSNYIIQDEMGVESPLGKEFDSAELSNTLSIDYASSRFGINLSNSRSISDSPFSFNFFKVTQTANFNDLLTQVFISYGFGFVDQPLSYYTDLSNASRKARPITLNSRTITLGIDQVLSSKLRTYIELETNEKTDRPRFYGLSNGYSYAFSGRDIFKFEVSRAQELKSYSLKDERGYFSSSSAELNYSRYISYDFYMTVGYGLVVETEDNPQSSRKDQLAIDVYTLAMNYQGKNWTAGLKTQKQLSNLNYKASLVAGDFSWIF